MKIISKEITYYHCDVCNFASILRKSVEECEIRHKCHHCEVVFTSEFYFDEKARIDKKCKNCHKVLSSFLLEDIEGLHDLEEEIFNLILKLRPYLVSNPI